MIATTLLGAQVEFSTWRKAMVTPLGFLVVGVITLALQFDGWHISLAPHGVELAGRLAARSFAGLSCLLFLALTTPATDFVGGLRRIGVPVEITDMALLMYRFVFLLLDTAESMHAAQMARLGDINRRRQLNSLSLLIANLLPRAFARAQALEVGLAARGWRGDLRVLTQMRRTSPANIGAILAAESLVLLIGLYFS
jgi:cobalt/nickel transport system permease protein